MWCLNRLQLIVISRQPSRRPPRSLCLPPAGLLRGRGRQGVHLQGAKVHAAVGDFPEAPQALLGQVWPRERQDHPGLRQGGGAGVTRLAGVLLSQTYS